jgi:hypothetical protein
MVKKLLEGKPEGGRKEGRPILRWVEDRTEGASVVREAEAKLKGAAVLKKKKYIVIT